VIKAPLRITALAVLVLGAVFWFIFSSTDGNQPVWGDDIFYLDYAGLGSQGYLETIATRGFIHYFYSMVHDMLGKDTHRTHAFYFFLLLAASVLFYLVLNQLMEARAALAGALFYMAYIGKYETVTWNVTGAYLVMAIVFLLSVFIALRYADRPWSAGLAIALLNWLAVHLYELLIIAAPLYPMLVYAHQRSKREPIRLRQLAAACLPLLMFLSHWALVYLFRPGDRPLWMRNENMKTDPASLLGRIWHTFQLGVDASVGGAHADFAWSLFREFRTAPFSSWTMISLIACAAAAVVFWKATKALPRGKPTAAVTWMMLAAALYLILITPLVGFTVVEAVMSSRLLTLSGIGLALIAALVIGVTSGKPIGNVSLALVSALIFIEAGAMNAILRIDRINWQYDSHVVSQIRDLGIRLRLGDAIFLSCPAAHPAWGRTRKGHSQVENGSAELLLLLDHGLVNKGAPLLHHERLHYLAEVRGPGIPDPRMDVPDSWWEMPERLIPLWLRESDFHLMGIRRAEFVDPAGNLIRAVDFQRITSLPEDRKFVARIRP